MNGQANHQGGGLLPFDRDRELEGHRQLPPVEEIAQRERDRHRDRDPDRRDGYPPGVQHSTAGSIPIHQPVASRAGAMHSPETLLANHRAAVAGPPGRPNPLNGLPGPSAAYGVHPLQLPQQQQQQQQQLQLQQPGPSAPPVGDAARPMPRPGPGPPPQLNGNNMNGNINHMNGSSSNIGPGPPPGPQHPVFAPGPHSIPGHAGPSGTPTLAGGSQPPYPTGPQHDAQPQQGHALFGDSPHSQAPGQQQQPQQQPILNAMDPYSDDETISAHSSGENETLGDGLQSDGPDAFPHQEEDALEYLDQVKIRFQDQPQVYNHFLDIMKDFKSQAIDTPGVITRVSELFVGHSVLIQGFNTFLPPGYKIECGPENDPAIRVTTPMGTLVQTIPGGGFQPEIQEPPVVSAQQRFREHTPAGHGPLGKDGPHQGPSHDASAPPNTLPGPRNVHTPLPNHHNMDASGLAGAEVVANAAAAHHGPSERKGPVEFNHAISYVNKIKTRFHDNPETYKQFLEILQTYQREQKPIQDVYDQVTTLFQSAPDLLEDFKQFLPEHAAAQPKTTPSRLTEEPMGLPPPSHTPQPMRGDATKMPPIGSFAPPSATKETKKRPRVEKQIQPVPSPNELPISSMRSTVAFTNGNKKAKLHHRGAGAEDASMMEPTLTPVLSEPFPPPSPIVNSRKELQFFEKVKKALGRQKINDFLKLCNLYNQNIIDRTSLYERGAAFLTGSPDLLLAWKTLLGLDTQFTHVAPRPAPPSDKVSLSNCRGYGPSYRLLPQRERLRPCSGRDELCNSVLNDEWASHPTWASEDSGFVAHRKNQFEEGLHRVEEERHDYDFNIEANVKCIQLLEPIAQQMLIMTQAEREAFSMTEALAGQTVSIFKRVAKKLYGEKGISVINDMWGHPFEVVPILLARMKQKDEDWRFSQREWNKVWHQQSDNMHLRSLDHMGIHVKINDKRNMSAKHLVDVIKTRAEDQRRERDEKTPRDDKTRDEDASVGSGKQNSGVDAHQFTWDFGDKDLMADLVRLVLIFNYQNGQHSSGEKSRVHAFFLEIVAPYFDISDEVVSKRMPDFSDESGDDDGDEPMLAIGRNGKKTGKRGDLRRGVLDRLGAGAGGRARDKEDSAASGSKETTPDGTSANEEDMPDLVDDGTTGTTNKHWLGVAPEAFVLDPDLVKNPQAAAVLSAALSSVSGRPKADSLFTRQVLNFFCNQTIFVLFSVVQALYQRMKEVKNSTDSVLKAIERQSYDKPARLIGLADNVMEFFKPTDTPAEFWPKTMELLEEFLEGEREESSFHEVLRFYYMKCGWKLYTIQELIKTLCRLSLVCTSPDPKEKTSTLINMYMNSRHVDQTSFQAEIATRKDAEKCIKEGEMFVMTWNPAKAEAKVRWLQKDDPTFGEPIKDVTARWQYYISSYMRIEPTEGVPRRRLQKSVLGRNLPGPESELDPSSLADHVSTCQELGSSICVLSFKMLWKPNTSEYFVCDNAPPTEEGRTDRTDFQRRLSRHRECRLQGNFIRNNSWMKDLSQDDVQQAKNGFQNWVADGILAGAEEADVEMAA